MCISAAGCANLVKIIGITPSDIGIIQIANAFRRIWTKKITAPLSTSSTVKPMFN